MRLKTWQAHFIHTLSNESTETLLAHYCTTTNSISSRIAAYKNNKSGTLISWLENIYQQVLALVGSHYFTQLGTSYISATPLKTSNFSDYSRHFPNHLQQLLTTRPELSDLPYLADVAQLDWHLHQSYYAENRKAFDLAGFSQLSESQQLRSSLQAAPDLVSMSSPWPLYELWEFHTKGGEAPKINTGGHAHAILIYRDQFKPKIKPISITEHSLLLAIQQGTTIEALPPDHLALLTKWIKKGWITGFTEPK